MEYLPYDQRPVSTEYRRVLEHILGAGVEAETRQGVNALTVMQQTMRFQLAEGFPVLTAGWAPGPTAAPSTPSRRRRGSRLTSSSTWSSSCASCRSCAPTSSTRG